MLFTDGLPDNAKAALAEGRKIKDDDITIYAIGTAQADMRFLRRLASSPDKAMFAARDELRQMFEVTAQKIYAIESR